MPWQLAFEDLREYLGTAWYEKRFAMPLEYAANRVALRFTGVDHLAKVWVNGNLAVEHEGSLTPFGTDITYDVGQMVGTVVPLSQVNDPVFSSGAMGKGYGIRPADGRVLAPFDGTVMVAMDTGHAVGLKSTDGVELLIHIGIDTVNLGGKHFTLHCKRGDVIHKGDPLVTADLAAITAAGYDPTTIVVCTNSGQFTDITTIATDEVDPATPVLAFTA